MIWRSKDAVVCGKHQNACGEANYKFCEEQGIKIARRSIGRRNGISRLWGMSILRSSRNLTEGMERAVDYKRYLEPVRACPSAHEALKQRIAIAR